MMTKPENCKYCGHAELSFIKDNSVFDPDSDIEEKFDSYVCDECKTIHVENEEISFIQREIDTNKLLQTTKTNISFL